VKTLGRPGAKDEIVRRLRALRPDSRRRWGRMNPHQAVCHLSDSFLAVLGRKPVSHAASVFRRTVMKWLALYVPLPWPPGISTRPELDQQAGGTAPAEFAADVAQLEALLELVTGPAGTFTWGTHPTLGPMSEWAWLRWGYLHCDHHLRQFGA
jgi:hypothetical protein